MAGLAASILLASCATTAAQFLSVTDDRQELAGAAAVRGEQWEAGHVWSLPQTPASSDDSKDCQPAAVLGMNSSRDVS